MMLPEVSFKPDMKRTHKNCADCGLLLPIEKYGKNKAYPDGRQIKCAKCQRKYANERRRRSAAK